MSNKRITQLVEITAAEVQLTDLFAIVDSSARETKKIQASQLSAWLAGSGSLVAIRAITADTASYVLGVNVRGIVSSSSFATKATNSDSASWASSSISASFAFTAAFAQNTNTSSTLATGSTVPITASRAITASFALAASQSQFLIYTGGNNGTASYAVKAADVGHATNADTASFLLGTIESASYALLAQDSATSELADSASFLVFTPGQNNGTSSYALSAGAVGGIRPYGVYLANTQSTSTAQLDTVNVLPSLNTPMSTSIEAVGTITAPFTSSILLNETLSLVVKSRDTGAETIIDATPIYVNISPTPGFWDSFDTGTLKVPFTMLGSTPMNGYYQVFVTASSGKIFFDNFRTTRFNIDSNSDVFSSYASESLQFNLSPSESVSIVFSSSVASGGPFTDFLPGFLATGSDNIISMSVINQGVSSIRYAWQLHNLKQMVLSGNPSLTNLKGMPNTLAYLSASSCGISSMLSLSNTSLYFLDVNNNNLSSLPTLPATMSYLNVSTNPFNLLPDPLPFGLTTFYCDSTQINSVTSLPNTITSMSLQSNSTLISIGTSLPTSLVSLHCSNTPLTSLPTIPSSTLYLLAANCALGQSAMDNICSQLVSNGLTNGILDISGNGTPQPSTIANIITLIGNGWTVTYDP